MITSHFHEGLTELPADWLADEYYGDDLHRLANVASSEAGISTLHEATGGDPSSTRRWQQNMAMGGDQKLIAGLRTRSGEVWGALGMYREPDRPMFDETEKQFANAVSPYLAEGTRRALLIGEATDPEDPSAPGLIALIFPLLMSAYGLTEHERDVTGLVLEGHSAQQVAETLYVSAHSATAPQTHF